MVVLYFPLLCIIYSRAGKSTVSNVQLYQVQHTLAILYFLTCCSVSTMALSRSLRSAFELELSRSDVNAICLTDVPMAIVAIVSEGMAMRSGVSASFVSSLAKANLNIRVIAKGSSKRQVAVVVKGQGRVEGR